MLQCERLVLQLANEVDNDQPASVPGEACRTECQVKILLLKMLILVRVVTMDIIMVTVVKMMIILVTNTTNN